MDNSTVQQTASLGATFTQLNDRQFRFVRPGGNWGDMLIYRGAEALAKRSDVTFDTVDCAPFLEAQPSPNLVIYLHGGGGLNPWTSGRSIKALLHAVHTYPGTVIQGPQTAANDQLFLSDLANRLAHPRCEQLILYARERVTYHNLQKTLPAWVDIRLDCDTAFHLHDTELLGGHAVQPRYDLLAIREDNEQPKGAYTLTDHTGVRLDPARYATTFDHWIRIHAFSRSIVTNRTHSSIAGAILGIPTTLLSSSSHKNHSIWEYSLAEKGVQWQEWTQTNVAETERRSLSSWPILRNVMSSYKVNRMKMWLQGVPWS